MVTETNEHQRRTIDRLVAENLIRGEPRIFDAGTDGVVVTGSEGGRYLVHPDGTPEVAHGRD